MHLALYRRYRPKSFDQVIGQEHITTTLKNQVINGEVSHAYLFTGSRGTGKTSCAKIFSLAINCLSPMNGSPCGKCTACIGLSEPNNTDILEIDAASNNRVDEIRDLRERVKYPAIIGTKKVYIIDEVHMLTDSAFNALLKTLEEPPTNVVFILATTEMHKLPATILSRVMKFDFHLVGLSELSMLLTKIFNDIHVDIDQASVQLIASAGDGSVRDTLSIADAVLSFCNGAVTYDKTLKLIGKSSMSSLVALVDAILSSDSLNIFNAITSLKANGKSITMLLKDTCTFLKNMMIIHLGVSDAKTLNLTENEIVDISSIVPKHELHRTTFAFAELTKLEMELKYSLDPEMYFAAGCIRAGGGVHTTAAIPAATNTTNVAPVMMDIQAQWGKTLRLIKEKGLYALSTAVKNIYQVTTKDNLLQLFTADPSTLDLLKDDARAKILKEIIIENFDKITDYVVQFEISQKPAEDIANDLRSMFQTGYRIV